MAVVTLTLGALGAGAQVRYVEASLGLEEPELDGGYTEVEMGDVDGDGNVDLVSVGDHGSPYVNTDEHGVMVFFGDGRARWTVAQTGTFGYGGVALGDVNGDGFVDVAYGIHHDYSSDDLGDQLLEVALGDGTGLAWTPWDDGLGENGETWGMFGTDLADVDGDGDLDLASISFGCCAGVHVYLNQGDGTWVESFGFLGGNSRQELTFGDLDGDARPDVVVAHDAGTVYLGDGSGGFVPADSNLPGGSYRVGVSVGDVDRDGADDLAWIRSGAPAVWGLGSDGLWRDLGAGLPASGDWQATQLAEMNGDGLTDLMAFGDGLFTLWLGDGAGSWTPGGSFTTPSPGIYAAFRAGADADRNGLGDIVLVAEEGGGFSGKNVLRFFREATPPVEHSVRWLDPGESRVLRAGATGFLRWATAVPFDRPDRSSRVSVAYRTEAAPRWSPIAVAVPDSGRLQWTVPPELAGERLRVAVVSTSGGSRRAALSPELSVVP